MIFYIERPSLNCRKSLFENTWQLHLACAFLSCFCIILLFLLAFFFHFSIFIFILIRIFFSNIYYSSRCAAHFRLLLKFIQRIRNVQFSNVKCWSYTAKQIYIHKKKHAYMVVPQMLTYAAEAIIDTVRTKNALRTIKMKTLRSIVSVTLQNHKRNFDIRMECN